MADIAHTKTDQKLEEMEKRLKVKTNNNEATVSIDGDTVTVTFNGDYGHLILISAESVPELTNPTASHGGCGNTAPLA